MRKPLFRPWTAEDNARVREFVANGASPTRAAAALNRTRVAISERARKIGCPFPTLAEARKKIPPSADSPWGSHRRPSRFKEDV
jgi:hypothetical protein